MQAGKNIQASEIFPEATEKHPYRCVGGNGLRGYVSRYNTEGSHAIVGRQGALCGCLNREDGQFYATEHAVVVDAFGELDKDFLFYFLTALNLNQYATATAQPGLAVSKIIEVLFPLPPFEEQKRIIDRIQLVEPLVAQYSVSSNKLSLLNNSINELLKKSILQEAIQGKLVPQIESEGNAETLLEEIVAEKQRLVAEGRLKRSVLSSSTIFRGDDNKYYERIGNQITDITDDLPFEIPVTWQWCHLPAIGVSELGKTMDKAKNSGTETPYLCSINVYWNRIDLSKLKTALFTEQEIKKYQLQVGDLLICEGGEVGRAAIFDSNCPVCFQNALHRIRFYNGIIPEYILGVLQAYKAAGKIDEVSKGVTIKHFTQTSLNSLYLPIPPINEQKRIVHKIRQLFQLLK